MLQEQALSTAHLVFLGATLGMIIDIYRVVVVLIHPGKYLAAAYDLLFWFVAAIWVFLYILGVTAGEVRLYMFLLLAAGYALEQSILGMPLRVSLRSTITAVVRLFSSIVDKVALAFNTLFDILVAPYRWFYRLIIRPFRVLWAWVCRPIVAGKANVAALRANLSQWWRGDNREI